VGRSFDDVMARLRAGEPAAAEAVVRRYARRLIALARARLGARLRGKEDPEDVVQSAYKSFFVRHAGGRFTLGDWGGLWALLVAITVRKCGRRAEHYRAARRDVRREAAAAEPADESGGGWEALDREPTPAEAAALAEAVETLLRGLEERDRLIVELSLQGCSAAAVAARVGCSGRTVERLRERVRQQLERRPELGG
jgi:RNA polymerase sigma-70 factor (ECF subfamily)